MDFLLFFVCLTLNLLVIAPGPTISLRFYFFIVLLLLEHSLNFHPILYLQHAGGGDPHNRCYLLPN